MPLGARIKAMGFMPDIGGLTNQMNEKFTQLIAELHTMQGILGDILAELKKQNAGGTP